MYAISWEDAFSKLYRGIVTETGERAVFLEKLLLIDTTEPFNPDDRRNLPHIYDAAFSENALARVEALHAAVMRELSRCEYDQCDEFLGALAFLQRIIMTAWAKYDLPIGDDLRAFASEFDRLDLPYERRRLYETALRSNLPG